jgi:Helix-turn-helix domain
MATETTDVPRLSGNRPELIDSAELATRRRVHRGVSRRSYFYPPKPRRLPRIAGRLVTLPNQHEQNQPVTSREVPSKEPAVPQKDGLLDVREAAELLDMSQKWLYRNWRSLPHVLIPAGKKPRIKFKREALECWIHSHSFN